MMNYFQKCVHIVKENMANITQFLSTANLPYDQGEPWLPMILNFNFYIYIYMYFLNLYLYIYILFLLSYIYIYIHYLYI